MKGIIALFRLGLLNFRLLNVGSVPLTIVLIEGLGLLFVLDLLESFSERYFRRVISLQCHEQSSEFASSQVVLVLYALTLAQLDILYHSHKNLFHKVLRVYSLDNLS